MSEKRSYLQYSWKDQFNENFSKEELKDVLKKRFESYFKESYISNNFLITANHKFDNSDKVYDYAIYNRQQVLVMVVTIMFSLDDIDDDGETLPDGVIHHYMSAEIWKETFENMIKKLMTDYDEFIEKQFQNCRNSPFPYPHYTDYQLYKSWNDLYRADCESQFFNVSLNNRLGDKLIKHYHHSIYHARRDGELSPYEAYNRDDLLRKVIANRIIYINAINPNKIVQGFNISKIATKVSVFSAGRAKYLINKYLGSYNTIFDPFSGFSGRMLGAVALNKKYIGQDISPIHINESKQILSFLTEYKVPFDVKLHCADTLESNGEFPCLCTCPPYSNKEQWQEVKVDHRSCDDWIDVCMSNFKCNDYLFIVDETKKYAKYSVDEITNKSHFSKAKEIVLLIKGGK